MSDEDLKKSGDSKLLEFNIRLQDVVDKGQFYIFSIDSTILGKDINSIDEKDLDSWNSL